MTGKRSEIDKTRNFVRPTPNVLQVRMDQGYEIYQKLGSTGHAAIIDQLSRQTERLQQIRDRQK